MKFNRFLLPNEHTQSIFWYILRRLEWEYWILGNFRVYNQFLRPNIGLIFQKKFSYLNIILGEQLLLATFSISINLKKCLFSKNVPNFFMSLAQTILKDINKSIQYAHWGVEIHWISSAWATMKFHNPSSCNYWGYFLGYTRNAGIS